MGEVISWKKLALWINLVLNYYMDQKAIQVNAVRDNAMAVYIGQVEKDLLQLIIDNMEKREMTLDEAHVLAKDYMALLPAVDKSDLMQKLLGYSELHPETQVVVESLKHLYETSRSQNTLEHMKHLIKQGDINSAMEVVKGGVD